VKLLKESGSSSSLNDLVVHINSISQVFIDEMHARKLKYSFFIFIIMRGLSNILPMSMQKQR